MSEEDALAGLSLQERELLQYLEDLQRNNPAEYDMIAKQVQEGGIGGALGGGGKKAKAPAAKGEMVTPEPGFVAKTHSFTHQARKTFINLCQSEHVDPPGQIEVQGGAPDECQMRIPLSLGPPREDLDKDGAVCCVYDVVFHPDTIASALGEKEFRGFVLQLALHQIKEKHGDELSEDLKFPKLANNYKGLAPLPQLMRRKGVSAAEAKAEAKPASEGGGWKGEEGEAAAGGRRPIVEEVSEPEAPATSLAAPTYVVEPSTWGGGGEGGGEGGAECLAVRMHLPTVEHSDELTLRVGPEALSLLAPAKYSLSIALPRAVSLEPLACCFESDRRILRVVLAAAAAATAGGADAGADAMVPDASEQAAIPPAERERRDKERRARARMREQRAAAKRGEAAAPPEEGSGGEAEADKAGEGAAAKAAEGDGGAGEGGGEGGATAAAGAEAAAAAEGAGGGDEAAAAAPTGGAPAEPGKLVLGNSIMWELEG